MYWWLTRTYSLYLNGCKKSTWFYFNKSGKSSSVPNSLGVSRRPEFGGHPASVIVVKSAAWLPVWSCSACSRLRWQHQLLWRTSRQAPAACLAMKPCKQNDYRGDGEEVGGEEGREAVGGMRRRRQSLAGGHGYVTPLMSDHHIRWDPPQHPCCWMPFSLYIS